MCYFTTMMSSEVIYDVENNGNKDETSSGSCVQSYICVKEENKLANRITN